MDQVARHVDRNCRRRYLSTLVLFNDREKSDFDTISERDSSAELSVRKSLRNSLVRNKSSQIVRIQSIEAKVVNKHEQAFNLDANRPTRKFSHRIGLRLTNPLKDDSDDEMDASSMHSDDI